MKEIIILLLVGCLLSFNPVHSQNKEINKSNNDLSSFVGEWVFISDNTEFVLKLFKDTYDLKNNSTRLDLLVGRYKLTKNGEVLENNIDKEFSEKQRYLPMSGMDNTRSNAKTIILTFSDTINHEMFNVRLSIDSSNRDSMTWDMTRTKGVRIKTNVKHKGSHINKIPKHMVLFRK